MSEIAAFSEKKYKRLLSQALPCAIHNDEEYERLHAILAEIEHRAAVRELTPEEERLSDLLFALIEPYEQEKIRSELPQTTPLEFLRSCMEDRELRHKDVWPLFGSRGVASEVLSGKREISKAHAKKLAEFFGVGIECFI